jgi:hypothetical protein
MWFRNIFAQQGAICLVLGGGFLLLAVLSALQLLAQPLVQFIY